MIVDFKRVHHADSAASKLIVRTVRAMAGGETEIVFASIDADRPLDGLIRALAETEEGHRLRQFRDTDAALEWCEDQLLAGMGSTAGTKFALRQINLFDGLTAGECKLVEGIVRPLVFEKGDVIMRAGDPAKLFFVLARGTVSVEIKLHGEGDRYKRIASIGPGLTFGEMALLDGGTRSADVIANERVVCYGLGVEELQELSKEHPNVMIAILGNLTREFSERLRHANDEISVLE